jgi:hypothetical protein
MGKAYIIKQADTGTITQALTTAFHAPVAIDLAPELSPDGKSLTVTAYPFHISAVYIHVHAIAGGCTKLTLRISPDSTGDEMFVPDTQATLSTGYTTAARGGVVYKVDVDGFLDTDTLYWTVKTDAGTATLKDLKITFSRPE